MSGTCNRDSHHDCSRPWAGSATVIKDPVVKESNGVHLLSGSTLAGLVSLRPSRLLLGLNSVSCLPQHLPDAAARLKGKRNWFQFPAWDCPPRCDLDQGSFTVLPGLSLFALHTVLKHVSGIFFFSLFLLCGFSSCLALCPDPLQAQQNLPLPSRITMGTKTETGHWLLAGWQIPGRTCSWEGTGAAWPVFPGLRIDLTLVNEEHMVRILRWGDLLRSYAYFCLLILFTRWKYLEGTNIPRKIMAGQWSAILGRKQ